MNLSELTGKVVDTHPAIPAAMAAQVIRTALKTIRAEIEGLPEGIVSVQLLGQFRIRNVEAERDGKTAQVRRTLFVVPKGRAASALADTAKTAAAT